MRTSGEGCLYRMKKSPFWWMGYSLRGKQFNESTRVRVLEGTDFEKSKRDAEKILRRRLQEVGADLIGAKEFITPKNERITVDDILDELTEDMKIREKFTGAVSSQMKHVRQFLGDRTAISVMDKDVRHLIQDLQKKGKKNATINRSTQLLGRAFKLSSKKVGSGPVIPHLSEADNVRRGFIDQEDFETFVAFLPEDLQDFVRFGYLTGWRKGTISRLDWSMVDFRAMTILIPGTITKTGQSQTIPLELVSDIIERREAGRSFKRQDGTSAISSLVFFRREGRGVTPGSPVQNFDDVWMIACHKAGIGKLLFHDLRRSAARNLTRAPNVSESVAMSITGHRTRSMFQRYNIVDVRDQRAAVESLKNFFETAKTKNVVPFKGSK
jgi:integrase